MDAISNFLNMFSEEITQQRVVEIMIQNLRHRYSLSEVLLEYSFVA